MCQFKKFHVTQAKTLFEHLKKNLEWTEEYKITQSDTLLVQ